MIERQYWPRHPVSFAGAASVTLALFFMMQMLVKQDGLMPFEPVASPPVFSVPPRIDPPPLQSVIELPEPVPTLLSPTEGGISFPKEPQGIELPAVWRPPGPVRATNDAALERAMDGGLMPLVTIEPNYPGAAVAKGIEGYVVVEFAVTIAGKVEGAHIVETDPPGVFDREALRAIRKFRFKPRIVAGKPEGAENVKYKFTFTLDN